MTHQRWSEAGYPAVNALWSVGPSDVLDSEEQYATPIGSFSSVRGCVPCAGPDSSGRDSNCAVDQAREQAVTGQGAAQGRWKSRPDEARRLSTPLWRLQ
jgi:hypothetical protein